MKRLNMHPELCRGCKRCEVACIAAHHNLTMKEAMKRKQEFRPRVQVLKPNDYKTAVRCHMCDHPACVAVCPNHALRVENGIIKMHEELCISCGMCVFACPYGVVQFEMHAPVHNPGDAVDETPSHLVATRCDLCEEWRQANGKDVTACVEACPAGAIGVIQDDGTEVLVKKAAKKA